MSDLEIQHLESQFPSMSGQAFAAARKKVLESGQCVLQTEGAFLIRVYPDGRRETVKEIEPPTLMEPGTVITIK